jgi:hypothetical protein
LFASYVVFYPFFVHLHLYLFRPMWNQTRKLYQTKKLNRKLIL